MKFTVKPFPEEKKKPLKTEMKQAEQKETYSKQAAFSILPCHVRVNELRWRVHVMVDLHHRRFPVAFVAYHQCLICRDNVLMVLVQWVPR